MEPLSAAIALQHKYARVILLLANALGGSSPKKLGAFGTLRATTARTHTFACRRPLPCFLLLCIQLTPVSRVGDVSHRAEVSWPHLAIQTTLAFWAVTIQVQG